MIDFEDVEATRVTELMSDRGVLAVPFGKHRMRTVTHLDVSDDQIDEAIGIIVDCVKDCS